MRDRNAIHKLVDRVLDEIDEDENFVDLEIESMSISLRAMRGEFNYKNPYVVNLDYNPDTSFTMDDAELMIKKLDKLADTAPESDARSNQET